MRGTLYAGGSLDAGGAGDDAAPRTYTRGADEEALYMGGEGPEREQANASDDERGGR